MSLLQQSWSLGSIEMPNRVVMAPLTRCRAFEGDVLGELHARYYAQRASAGLIISEATQIHPMGKGYPNTPGIYSEAQRDGWRMVTDAVHDAGGRIFAQLWHVGRISHPEFLGGKTPVAPSAINPGGQQRLHDGSKADRVTPRALRADEIPELVEQYRHAAAVAKDAGFDGVEIHNANTYLLDQFLRTSANQRDDQYGGSLENRMRFPLMVARAVCDVWGGDRVGVRISPAGTSDPSPGGEIEETFSAFARELDKLGVVYLHLVEPGNFHVSDSGRFNTERLRDHFSRTLIANGGYEVNAAADKLGRRRADLIAYGQLFIANPDLPRRLGQGGPFNEPNPDTYYGGGAEGYTDYPFLDEA